MPHSSALLQQIFEDTWPFGIEPKFADWIYSLPTLRNTDRHPLNGLLDVFHKKNVLFLILILCLQIVGEGLPSHPLRNCLEFAEFFWRKKVFGFFGYPPPPFTDGLYVPYQITKRSKSWEMLENFSLFSQLCIGEPWGAIDGRSSDINSNQCWLQTILLLVRSNQWNLLFKHFK